MGGLQIGVLGSLTIRYHTESLRPLRSNKAEALLVYLVTEQARQERARFGREQLMALLWPEMPESSARHNLRQTLYLLRQAIPTVPGPDGEEVPLLLGDRQTVAVNPAATYALDLARFFRLAATGEAGTLREAADLYRGPFLADFYLEDSNSFEAWAAAHRADVQREAEDVLAQLVALAFARADLAEAESMARRWAALDDLAEPPQQALVLALARQGQRAAAARHYRAYAERLEAGLGVEPARSLDELLAEAGTDAPAPAPAPPEAPARALPTFPTPFVGREAEVERLQAYLTRPDVRLVTVVGPGGAGKTRLAVEALREQAGAYADGLFFVPLAELEDAGRLPAVIAETLGLSLRGPAPAQAQLLSFLRERRCLLILDNFERLLPGAPLLQTILEEAPGARLVVTSQERLNLEGEWLLRLGGLPVADEAAGAAAGAAVRLLVQAATRVRADFALTEGNRPHLVRICRLLQGMPLGIELAAFWLRHLDSETLAEEIAGNIGFLESTLPNLPARHRSLQAIFDYTWQRLAPEERRLLRTLSVFQGGFTLPAARQVAGASLSALAALADKSLLQPPAGGGGRYRLHAHLRQFIAGLLAADPAAAAAARARHADFFAGWLARHEAALSGAQLPHALARVTDEIENVHAAWGHAAGATGADPAGTLLEQMAQPLLLFYEVRGWFGEAEARFRLAGEQPLPADTRPLILAVWGWFGFRNGNYEEAYGNLEESLALAEDARVRMLALSAQALLLTARGQFAEAAARAQASLDAGRGLAAEVLTAFALHNLGSVARVQERYAEASRHYRESRLLFQAVGNSYGAAFALINLGTVQLRRGETAAAARAFREGLALCEQAGYRYGQSVALRNLALALLAGGEAAAARPLARESLALAEAMADAEGAAWARMALAQIAAARGRLPAALQHYDRAQALFARLGHQLGLADLAARRAAIKLARGDLARAEAGADQALTAYTQLGQREGQAVAHSLLARIHAAADRPDPARHHLEQARALVAGLEAQAAVAAVAVAEKALGETTTN